jgi:hypothetical protein
MRSHTFTTAVEVWDLKPLQLLYFLLVTNCVTGDIIKMYIWSETQRGKIA